MTRQRIAMPNLKEIFRLKHAGYSNRAIHRSIGVARATISDYLDRAQAAGLTMEQALELSQDELEQALFPQSALPADTDRPLPDWGQVFAELQHKGVTRRILWEEYREQYPEGLGYTQFCERYNRWRKWHKVNAHIPHPAGESMEVDYAGPKVQIIDPATGEIREESVFVACLPLSDFLFTELHPEQSSPHWIGGHTRAVEAFGGVPRIVRPDNLKAGVKSPCRYEPEINPTYQAWADHYGAAVIPARVRKPRDKASVENGVQFVERQVLARIRHRVFYGHAEAAQVLRELTEAANRRPRTDWPGKVSRRDLLEQLERPNLRPLPERPFEYVERVNARVAPNYHVAHRYQHYSVPWKLVGRKVEMRISEHLVEIFHRGERIAVHPRRTGMPGYSTLPEHMPEGHRIFLEGTLSKLLAQGKALGPAVAQFMDTLVAARAFPEQAYGSCQGVLSLARRYPAGRMAEACDRLIRRKKVGYRALHDELKKEYKQPAPSRPALPAHEQVRGGAYFS